MFNWEDTQFWSSFAIFAKLGVNVPFTVRKSNPKPKLFPENLSTLLVHKFIFSTKIIKGDKELL